MLPDDVKPKREVNFHYILPDFGRFKIDDTFSAVKSGTEQLVPTVKNGNVASMRETQEIQ